MFENRVNGTFLNLHYVAVKNNTSAKSVKGFISGHSAFIFDFDEIVIRHLHIFLLYVILTNIGTDPRMGVQKLHLRLYRKTAWYFGSK